MADADDPRTRPHGSVAEETARLLDALLGESDGVAPTGSGRDRPTAGARAGTDPSGDRATCPTCGAVDPGVPAADGAAPPLAAVCHLCPVCQLLQVARSVRPETVDRLADLAGALTQTLRDLAATRRAGPRDPASDPGRRAADVEDIVVGTDDEQPDDEESRP